MIRINLALDKPQAAYIHCKLATTNRATDFKFPIHDIKNVCIKVIWRKFAARKLVWQQKCHTYTQCLKHDYKREIGKLMQN